MPLNKKCIKLFSLVLAIALGFVISENTFAYEASITTSGNINLSVISTGAGAGIATDNVNVVSTCPSGYDLYVAATSDTNSSFNDTNLYKSGDNTSASIISASTGTSASPVSITGNNLGTWGYSTTSSSATGTFIGLTTTPTIISSKDSISASGGDNIPVYYGASAPTTLEPGIYKMSDDAVITYYLTTSTECAKYTIAYDDNNATAGTMGIQTQDDNGDDLASNSVVTLYPSNFSRVGYGFAGWSLDEIDPDSVNFSTDLQSAITAGKVFGPQETITLNATIISEADINSVITMHAIWIKAETNTTLQTWNGCGAMTAATFTGDTTDQSVWSITTSASSFTALTDERDGETYTIAKLTDGRCWMIENLRLADTHQENNTTVSTTLTTANTNNPSLPLTNIYDTSSTSNHLSPTSDVAYDASTAPEGWCSTDSSACDDQSRLKTNNTANRATYAATDTMSVGANLYSYGNYYNWYSATAGNGKFGSSYGAGYVSPGDICPAGWHLPTGDGFGEFGLLSNSLGGYQNSGIAQTMTDSTTPTYDVMKQRLTHFPNNLLYAGGAKGAVISQQGDSGYYWSSTGNSNNGALFTYLGSVSYVYPGTDHGFKYTGRTIRCIASTNYTVSFNANGGTGTMGDQSIPVGTATNLASNSFTRSGYEFIGWNTAPDGSGIPYSDARNVTDIALPGRSVTLYAQWGQSCPANRICYMTNGSNVEGSMGQQQITSSSTSITLLASNYSRTSYGFAGWNTKVDGTGINYGPQETIEFTAGQYSTTGLKLYAKWIASAGNLQNWSGCSSLASGAVTALTDQRDNETYAVAKLADGNCWMIENLRLENTASHNSDGILAQGYGISSIYGNFSGLANPEASWAENSIAANSLYSTDGSGDTINIDTSNADYRFPRYNNVNTPVNVVDRPINPTSNSDKNSTTKAGLYSYGNYYTWSAAIADTTDYTSGNHDTTSICPAGWHIPTGDNSGEFYALNTAISAGATDATASNNLRTYPNNFVYSGDFIDSGAYGLGAHGFYWSSTAADDSYAAELFLSDSDVYPGMSNSFKYVGDSVRCIVSS